MPVCALVSVVFCVCKYSFALISEKRMLLSVQFCYIKEQLLRITEFLPELWLTNMNLCLKRGRIIPKLSLMPLTHRSWCTMPPASSPRSSLVIAPASTEAWRETTATKWGGPSLLPSRRFSVRTLKDNRHLTSAAPTSDSKKTIHSKHTMSFLFWRSWLALCLLSIFFCSFLCFLVRAVTDTLPERESNTGIY